MSSPTMTARRLSGTLYRGHEPLVHDVEGILFAFLGAPRMAVIGPFDPPWGEAGRLAGAPLTVACFRGPLLQVDVQEVQGRGGRTVLVASCRPRAFGPPLEVLDEVRPEDLP